MKKKNFITVLLLFTISFVYSQNEGINFSNINFEEALKKAESENKMIFIDAYASWCGPCKMMDKTIFKDIDVGDFYNENFINLKIDMEKGEGPKLKGKFGGMEVALSLASGDGKEHMALVSALINLPVGVRFAALTKEGVIDL